MRPRSLHHLLAVCLVTPLVLEGCGSGNPSASSSSTSTTLAVTSIAPSTLTAGAGATTLTVTGTGFSAATAVQVGGAVEQTTFVSSTQITASIPASQIAAGGVLSVVAESGTSTSGSGTPVNLTVNNPAPVITSFTPSSFLTGASSPLIAVTGTGFVPTTMIEVGGSARATAFVSSTEVNVTLTSGDLATGGPVNLTAVNPAPGGGTSAASSLAVNNPAPAIAALTPQTLTAGAGAATTVTVTGSNFLPNSQVQVGGTNRATTFVSGTQLTFPLSVADQASAALLGVAVVNPAPGGGSSGAVTLTVANPAPVVTALNPATVVSGATTVSTIQVAGTGFVATSQVQVGGVKRATTYVSPTQLAFQLTVADQAQTGSLAISVVNAAPGGGNSSTLPLTVAAPTSAPTIVAVTPNTFTTGSGDTTLSVSGTGFTASSTVQWNGAALQTMLTQDNYGIPYLSAAVPAALLLTAGTATITLNSPTATPPISNAVTVTITNPPAPTLASVSPSSAVPINQATTLTLNGTGFTSATTVAVNGTTLPSTLNSGSLQVTIPAGALSLLNANNLTVTTPAPGGGTTAPFALTAYVGLVNNSMVYNPANGLFYLSIPSSVGAPYGNSVVSVDPTTGALGQPIQVGSEPNKLAISSDGTVLWVGLDGASAVRQVNLTTGTAGLQFTIGGNSGLYEPPGTALALLALPGAPNSVVVSFATSDFGTGQLGIFDSGALRGSLVSANITQGFDALQVNGSLNEIYVAGGSSYETFTYSSSGLTAKANISSGNTFAENGVDEIQLANGMIYTDYGQASDAESGALLGTFYSSGTMVADGSIAVDTTLGKAFILDNASGQSYSDTNQIQIFNLSDYTSTGSAIPIASIPYNGFSTTPDRLTRWGTNGLAFRSTAGFFSLRSNLVKDLSATNADLSVTVAASGPATTGSNTTYTATVANAGPAASTNIALTGTVPSTGVLLSATPSAGTCSTGNGVNCDLGSLASGASATVTFVVEQTTAGTAITTASVNGSENDPTPANNQATNTTTITGAAFNLVPSIASIAPNAIQTGSSDTTITVTGAGFGSGAVVQLGTSALTTTYVSSTQLTATVPSAQAASIGWAPVTVANPAPGGGGSNAVPLSYFGVIPLGANHLLYDPFSRNIMASVGSGSSTVTGNSIVAITPDTATVGTPVAIGSQPTNLALTSDGQILYTILSGSQSVARFNMLTQQPDYTYVVPPTTNFDGGIALRGLATQPGTENTIALDLASFTGNAIYDFDPVNKTASIRGQASGPYSGSCLAFLDAGDLLAFDIDTSGSTFDHYMVTAAGFTYYNYSQYTESTLNHFGCFKLSGGLAFANAGGVANPAPSPATQIGVFPVTGGGGFSNSLSFAPDASLQRAFYMVNTAAVPGGVNSGSAPDGIEVFDQNTFLPTGTVNLNMETIEGNTSYTGVDVVRWGQDGLAILTSGGHIYLVRGAIVAPQELQPNSAATLSASSTATISHGSGNTLLTLTGSNFVPGVAVTWNGAYRTTTIVDATHVSVAIPSSDLAAVGTASLVATNPGASASGALTITIN